MFTPFFVGAEVLFQKIWEKEDFQNDKKQK
jgi:hypothetical protein